MSDYDQRVDTILLLARQEEWTTLVWARKLAEYSRITEEQLAVIAELRKELRDLQQQSTSQESENLDWLDEWWSQESTFDGL